MYKALLVLSAVVVSTVTNGDKNFEKNKNNLRIIGGHDADISDYPYMLSVVYNNSHFCGAALIDPQWAVTACHCVDLVTADEVTIQSNSTYIDEGETVTVSKVIPHPKFIYQSGDSDIALLKLSTPLNCKNCKPIKLAKSIPAAEENVTVTGWGYTTNDYSNIDYDYDGTSVLQVATIPVVDTADCNQVYKELNQHITENMFCAGVLEIGGVDACVGDSGGPAVYEDQLVGLVSWGEICGMKYPGVYTVVPNFLDWIQEQTGIITAD